MKTFYSEFNFRKMRGSYKKMGPQSKEFWDRAILSATMVKGKSKIVVEVEQ